MIAWPRLSPTVGVAGMPTNITVWGALPGDFVLFTLSDSCASAYTVVNSNRSLMAKVSEGIKYGEANLISTTVAMTAVVNLNVCVATKESEGNSADDYVMIGNLTFNQVKSADFDPKRTVQGAAQQFTPHPTPHTPHLTPHTSHPTPHTSPPPARCGATVHSQWCSLVSQYSLDKNELFYPWYDAEWYDAESG